MRVSEMTDLRWEDVHLDRTETHVRRLKGSKSTMHPLQGDELRARRKLRRENTSSLSFVFFRAGRIPWILPTCFRYNPASLHEGFKKYATKP